MIFPGAPGPPVEFQVTEMTDSTASLSWGPGPDNHSPVLTHNIQARTTFSLGWQGVITGACVCVCARASLSITHTVY